MWLPRPQKALALAAILKVWFLDRQHYLGTYWKYKFCDSDPLIRNSGVGPVVIVVMSPPGLSDAFAEFENPGLQSH